MKRIIPFLLVVLFIQCGVTEEKTKNKTAIDQLLTEFNACKEDTESDKKKCKTFTAEAICKYNGIDDFESEEGGYVDYHDIYELVNNDSKWTFLGEASTQDVLDNAQDLANRGYPVIAVDAKDKHKFCVLIIEGEMAKSGSWGLNAPNCAAFFPGSRPEPFINKTLNYAFSKNKSVEIFVKK